MSPTPRLPFLWFFTFLLLFEAATASTLPVDGYSIRVWETEDGLPLNAVSCATQTADGYLWIGTYAGLARFDGKRFRVFSGATTPALEDGRISALFQDARGTLWIGHETGAITRYQDEHFKSVTQPPDATRGKIIALGGDEDDRVWSFRESGAIHSVEGNLRLPSMLGDDPPGILSWNRSSRGEIWLSENGQAARVTHGTLSALSVSTADRPNYVLCVAASAKGGAWLVCAGEGIRRWQDGRWVEDRGPYPAPPGPVSCGLELRDGTFVLGTINSGLFLVFPDGRPPVHLDETNGLPQNWVRFLYEDREGNLWAGAGSGGLVSIRKSPFSILTPPDRWQGRTVISVAPGHDRSLWVGTEGAGLYRFADGKWTRFGGNGALENLYIWAASESSSGEVWVGNYWWGGPYRLQDGRFSRHPKLDTRSPPVLALEAGSAPGELLVGNREGLLKLTSDAATWLYHAPAGTHPDICAIARDRNNVIWFGSAHDGLGRVADGVVSTFRKEDGLSSNEIQCLLLDSDTGALWIGTSDAGLMRFKDGKFSRISTANGLVDNSICQILIDDFSQVWLSTHNGLQQIDRAELDRCADGRTGWLSTRIYNRNHGLPTLEFSGGRQGSGTRTADRMLVFASSKGLVTVDPSRIETNPRPPPVVIDSFIVDTKPVSYSRGQASEALPPSHERLEFYYAGLSFAAPDRVLFRYMLEGLDKDWVPAGDLRTATYSHLPAGNYRFRVVACNSDGIWNLEGATLAFAVTPYYWQTWWFRTLCSTLVLSLVAGLARYFTRRRYQHRVEQLERLHAIEHERSRIARDIHDDLGGNLTHIAILSQPAGENPVEGKEAAGVLSGIHSAAQNGMRALDEIVWAVDPHQDTLDSLVSYMGRYAQEALEAAKISCRLSFPLELPPWPLGAEVRHNLFLAFKETLNNTLKHAAATEVRISVVLEARGFRVLIRDNGKGFDPKPHPGAPGGGRVGGGHGLPNLERRLAAIGGRCEVTSAPSAGTEVALIVNVPPDTPPDRKTSRAASGDGINRV